MKKYKVQFSKGWSGMWMFEALSDIRAWEIARRFVFEHAQTIYVEISEIWELDKSENTVRKIENYEEYFTPYKVHYKNEDCILKINKDKDDYLVWQEVKRVIEKTYNCKDIDSIEQLEKNTNTSIRKLESEKKCKENREKDKIENQGNQKEFDLCIAYFSDGSCSEPYIVEYSIDDKKSKSVIILEKAKQIFKNEVIQTENILQEEKAIYKIYFSNGECSAPYIAEIKEKDINAIEIAGQKLLQYIKYNGIENKNINIIKIEELNEDNNFITNIERKQRNEKRIYKKPERKNRIINIR